MILNQKLINKNKKKDRNFKQHTKKKRKKEGEKETVKLTTDIDRPYTMVRFARRLFECLFAPPEPFTTGATDNMARFIVNYLTKTKIKRPLSTFLY